MSHRVSMQPDKPQGDKMTLQNQGDNATGGDGGGPHTSAPADYLQLMVTMAHTLAM